MHWPCTSAWQNWSLKQNKASNPNTNTNTNTNFSPIDFSTLFLSWGGLRSPHDRNNLEKYRLALSGSLVIQMFFSAPRASSPQVFSNGNCKSTSLSEVSGTSNHCCLILLIVFHRFFTFRLYRDSPGSIGSKPWTHKNTRKGPTERTHQCLEEWNSRNAGVKKDYPPILASLAIGLAGTSCELRNEIKNKYTPWQK